jgi:hypothetical protein
VSELLLNERPRDDAWDRLWSRILGDFVSTDRPADAAKKVAA